MTIWFFSIDLSFYLNLILRNSFDFVRSKTLRKEERNEIGSEVKMKNEKFKLKFLPLLVAIWEMYLLGRGKIVLSIQCTLSGPRVMIFTPFCCDFRSTITQTHHLFSTTPHVTNPNCFHPKIYVLTFLYHDSFSRVLSLM